jgi:methanogenic corrinoid protein MtbC1
MTINQTDLLLKENYSIALEIFESDLKERSDIAKIKDHYLNDTVYTINFLTIALEVRESILFDNYMRWFGKLAYYLNFDMASMQMHFKHAKTVLEKRLDPLLYGTLIKVYNRGIDTFINTYQSDHETKVDINPFLELLLDFKTNKAYDYVLNYLDSGQTVSDLYLDLFQPTLYQVGELWQQQVISVATEHYITAAIQHIIGKLYPKIFSEVKDGKNALVAVCAGKELHEVGLRMVADFFELAGWKTHFLGSNIPIKHVVNFLKENKVDTLAISATTSANLVDVKTLIETIKQDETFDNLQIMVGGKVFNDTPNLWRKVGADMYAQDAEQAVMIANMTLRVQAV